MVVIEFMFDKVMVEVCIFLVVIGLVMVIVMFMVYGFGDFMVKEFFVIFFNFVVGIELICKKVEMNGDGDYVVEGLCLFFFGCWYICVEIFILDFEMMVLEGDVMIGL